MRAPVEGGKRPSRASRTPAFCRLWLYSCIFAAASVFGIASGRADSYPLGMTSIMKRIGVAPYRWFFKGPANLYTLVTMPVGVVCELISSKERAGVPSAKTRLPVPIRALCAQQDGIDEQHDLICKTMLDQGRRQRGATREDKVRLPPDLMLRMLSSIALLGAFGQKADHISYVRRPSS